MEIPAQTGAGNLIVNHLDEETLARHALPAVSASDIPETAGHLGECAECTVRFSGIRAFYEALTARESWEPSVVPDSRRGCEEQLVAFAARAQKEYVEAQATLSPILADQVAFIRESIASKPQYRTAGVVRVLAEAANAVCDREPIHARNLADAALAIAGFLPEREYPPETIRALRGLAWKERANALRSLADYDGALEALDNAASELAHFGGNTFELASLAYIRALILADTNRLNEATQQAAESATILAEYGDLSRAARSRSLQAELLYNRGEYGAAEAIYEELLAFALSKGDGSDAARWAYNAASCWIELGDGDRAEELLIGAKETYRSLAMHAAEVRADCLLGVAARVAGRLEESERRLRAARESCKRLGLAGETANASLDLIESLLLIGPGQKIDFLCTSVVRHYRRAGKSHQALAAAAFLRQEARQGTLRVETVREVRRFVAALEREPELVFVALG